MDYFEILQKLSETAGPSGFEQRVAEVVSDLWEPYTESIIIDRVGSVLATRPGSAEHPRPRLLLAAHMDEIGLMVTELKEHNGYGFLRVTKVGGVDVRHLYAQRVIIHGRRDLPGVLASLPSRLLPSERQNKPYGYEDLVVDPGLPYSTLRDQVEIGDFISFHQPFRKLMGKNVAGKALDNRASIAAVTACLYYLNGRSHEWDVVAVATAQEETRLLGAYTSAFSHNPDVAIAIDVTFAKGAAYSDASAVELDSGPVLEIGPNIHPGIVQALRDAAEVLEMNVSFSTHTRSSGTDAFAMQVARSGIPTGLVSIPLRYMHTMVEIVNTRDIKRTGRLLAELVVRLDSSFLPDLSRVMMEED